MKELQLAKELAREAGELLLRYSKKTQLQVRKKGVRDLVTEADEKAQALIVKKIRKAFPEDSILAEEGELSKTEIAERLWIIDPLDGTTNFRFGYPVYCVSIAFQRKGKLEAGVIYDPSRDEMFWAARGKGARLNGKKIQIRKKDSLAESLLVTGFPYELEARRISNFIYFEHFVRRSLAVRRDGSAALNLAYVAAGRFSGFWELGLQAWDIAAGILLVEEAGGKIEGLPNSPYVVGLPKDLVAGSASLNEQMLKEINEASTNR